jgi:hypothetical protein
MRTIEAVKSNAVHIRKTADCADSRSLATVLSELCDLIAQLRDAIAAMQEDNDGGRRKMN